MQEEIAKLLENVKEIKEHKYNKYVDVYEGNYLGKKIVFAKCGVGQVFASSLATVLITVFGATHIIFTGVAGGLKHSQQIGDIVVAKYLINYDMDCSKFVMPSMDRLHKRGEIPYINLREFHCDQKLIQYAMEAPNSSGKIHTIGPICTVSQFMDTNMKLDLMRDHGDLDDPEAVEMEGSAVAQVCHTFDIPFVILRSISDTIHGDSNEDFMKFCQQAADELWPVVSHLISKIQ